MNFELLPAAIAGFIASPIVAIIPSLDPEKGITGKQGFAY